MEAKTAVAVLNALSHGSRLAAFRQLIRVGTDGMPVGALRERLGIPAATLTTHLNVLRAAALVNDRREGRVIRVRANFLQMNALLGYLTEHCCEGAADCLPLRRCEPGRQRAARTAKRTTTKKRP